MRKNVIGLPRECYMLYLDHTPNISANFSNETSESHFPIEQFKTENSLQLQLHRENKDAKYEIIQRLEN